MMFGLTDGQMGMLVYAGLGLLALLLLSGEFGSLMYSKILGTD
jgi:hypothetical protein